MAVLGANLPGDWKIDEAGKRGQLVKVKAADKAVTLTDAATDVAIGVLNYDHKANEQVSAKQVQAGQVLEVLCKGSNLNAGAAIGPDAANDGYGKVTTSGHRIGFLQEDYEDSDLCQVFIHPHG